MSRRALKCLVLGLALGEAAALAFVLVLTLFGLSAAAQLGRVEPLVETVEIAPPVAIAAAAGLALGALAHAVRRRRRVVLLSAAAGAYVLAAVGTTAHVSSLRGTVDVLEVLALGVWASAAYALYAVPGVVVATLALERWTRVRDAGDGGARAGPSPRDRSRNDEARRILERALVAARL